MKYGCSFRLSEIIVDVICFSIIALVTMHVQMTMVMPPGTEQFLAETFIEPAMLFRRYRALGAPQCVLDRSLLVIRPDGKGGQYLVTYSREVDLLAHDAHFVPVVLKLLAA